jgi:hypothetical protein
MHYVTILKNSLSGALFGCILLFVLPAIMNISNLKRKTSLSANDKLEIKGNYGMIVVGILMTILGVSVSVLKQIGKL